MNKKFNIAVDAMGGDNSPEKVLEGVNLLFEKNINARVNLYGDENIISSLIKKYKN